MNASRALVVLLLAAAPAIAAPPEEIVSPLVGQALPGVPGKRFTAVTVTFPPGARAAPHRHGGAFLYAYVLEGSVRSKLEGEPLQVYRAGQGWTEQPGAHHLLTENASGTASAKLLVIFVSEEGEALKTEDAAQ